MIITLEHVHLLDKSEEVAKMILQSEVMQAYEQAYHNMKNDARAQQLIAAFTAAKEKLEEVERFGRYHPDYASIMKEVRMIKREMDLHDTVAAFKLAERELQRLLDEISEIIAKSVSEHILVPKDDYLTSNQGCATGGCATGSACGCNVS